MTLSRPAERQPARSAGEPTAGPATHIDQRYEVLEQLGHGGMAFVYRVRDVSGGEPLALKQLVLHGAGKDRELRALFEREYHVLAQLAHPSVVEVYDFGIDAAGPYYTMELLESGDLTTRTPWPFSEACKLFMQVCSALSLLHSRRLVHRDVSPRNVRCTQHGVAKLIDFGAMVPMGPCDQVVGTPGFVAPEVVHHLALDARTDLFSLGATLYFALTGRRPFAARTLSDLVDLWRHDPLPPSQLVAGIPATLDALVMSLLRVDPALRPGSAFEVMQRLAAIAGTPPPASDEISAAYLATPMLVGRDTQQRTFRQALNRAMHGDGGGLLFQGASGLGRSRLLDTCALEAKTSGATVLRLAGRAQRPEAFAGAFRLTAQLMAALPDQAIRGAAAADAIPTLFSALGADNTGPLMRRLRPLESIGEDGHAVQAALQAWFRHVAELRSLVIAVDDIERIDEPSLALLVALVHNASSCKLLVVCTALSPIDVETRPALRVLQARCRESTLTPFSTHETNELFASVFFGAPHAALVSDRVYKLADGNVRDALALAKHLIERQVIRHADGAWVLPAELAVSDLPANPQAVLSSQLASLPALPRLLVECQAVAFEGPWTAADYCVIAGDTSVLQVEAALAALVRQGVIVEAAGAFTLSHLAIRRGVLAQVTDKTRVRHELAVARLCEQTKRPALVEVYHLLQGEDFERALQRLAQILEAAPTLSQLYRQSGIELKIIAKLLEQARALAPAHGRTAREICELTRLLLELSVVTDTALYYRYAAAWQTQIEHDCGLGDYRADQTANAPDRLQRALQTAMARYTNTPETQRVYRLDEAIKKLAHFVAIAIVVSTRVLDTKLFASLPGLLEPFAALSPILHALWQNAILAYEMTCNGQFEQGHARAVDVYKRLESVSGQDMPYVDAMRSAIAHAAAYAEVSLGHMSAEHWLAILDSDPFQRQSAKQLRRALHLFDGDTEAAERCKREAEVLAVQAHTRQMFEPALFDLYMQKHSADLVGVKHTVDRVAQLAAQWPGWRGAHHVALASFQHLRGDLNAAKAEYERALEATDPEQTDPPPLLRAWVAAAAGYTNVLAELGQLEAARAFGLHACQRCDDLHISSEGEAQVRALALAEAKLGDYATAAARLDRLIAKRAHLRPSATALDFEARARVAIIARDAAGAAHLRGWRPTALQLQAARVPPP